MPVSSKRCKPLRFCAIAVALAAPLSAAAEPLNAKPGAWEMTTTMVTTGAFIPLEEVLDNMPPDERARFEKRLQERSGKPSTRVIKTCVTQAQLQEALLEEDDPGHCTRKTLAQSSTKVRIEITCAAPNAHTASWNLDAPTPESMTVTSEVVLKSGAKLHVDVKGKWLGASCEGLKE